MDSVHDFRYYVFPAYVGMSPASSTVIMTP